MSLLPTAAGFDQHCDVSMSDMSDSGVQGVSVSTHDISPATTEEHSRSGSGFDDSSTDTIQEDIGDGEAQRSTSPMAPEYEELSTDDDANGHATLSAFEALPSELVQDIATKADSDLDISRLSLASPALAKRLVPNNADVWRERFLARYDYPFINTVDEFAFAYKIRRLVLRKLDGHALRNGDKEQAEHQLQVIKDMILETYNKHKPHIPANSYSKNLAAFASADRSPWIVNFTGCALFGNQRTTKGKSNNLFDTIHVTLSHLVLNKRSSIQLNLSTSRDSYDLGRVYLYNKPLELLLAKLPEEQPAKALFRSSRFPNLTTARPELPKPQYLLDMHSVLHIRNFFQRHFSDDQECTSENTYASMMRSLVASGAMPSRWSESLYEPIAFNTHWVGHYSCLHPWPKDRQDLEERQSCAEDWDHIDPMRLDLETSITNEEGAFWPPLFSSVPAFEAAMPVDYHKKMLNVTFIRGIAPFKELKDHKRHKQIEGFERQMSDQLPKWHPLLASRVHGFVHDIPEEAILGRKPRREQFSDAGQGEKEKVIPGWKRIIMVIYKPTTRNLVSVLEHAEEAYGGASGTEMEFNTAAVWNTPNDVDNAFAQAQQELSGTIVGGASEVPAAEPLNGSANNDGDSAANNNTNDPPTEEQIEAQLKKMLTRRIISFTKSYNDLLVDMSKPPAPKAQFAPFPEQKPRSKVPLPPLFSAKHIRQLEEEFSQAQYMAWDDGSIEYAYAYEGIVIPGGKIMLGRWWRIHGVDGMGAGKELGPDGVGVEVRPVERASALPDAERADTDESGSGNVPKGKKRKKKHNIKKNKRRSKKRKAKDKPKIHDAETDEEDGDADMDTSWEQEDDSDAAHQAEDEEVEYEFVTMVNGEESRAVNATKGLERGPFVFWTY